MAIRNMTSFPEHQMWEAPSGGPGPAKAGLRLLRDDEAAAVDVLELADHQLVGVVHLLALILEELGARLPAQVHMTAERRSVGAGIVQGELVADRAEIGA